MLAADGCASGSSNLACCFCGVWAPAGRGVAVAMFGLSLVWACSSDRNECAASRRSRPTFDHNSQSANSQGCT